MILFFYTTNFTSVSGTELIQLNDRISQFRSLLTQILSISIDNAFSDLNYVLLKINQVGLDQLNYQLIYDLTKTITKSYKLLTNEGLSFPGLFIIDKEGIIKYYRVNNLLCWKNINELLRILQSIQYIKENPG
jgi:peroxiredoxin (alkyl hydroperoxide reductase subunit C)